MLNEIFIARGGQRFVIACPYTLEEIYFWIFSIERSDVRHVHEIDTDSNAHDFLRSQFFVSIYFGVLFVVLLMVSFEIIQRVLMI